MFAVFVLFQSIFKNFLKNDYPVPAKNYIVDVSIKDFKFLLNALNYFFV